MGVYDELVINGFERACEKYPDKTAIIYLGEKFSYMKMKDLINIFAAALYDFGVKEDDKFTAAIATGSPCLSKGIPKSPLN